ncbi:MAG: glutamate-5-semialdehyde dehydrogenase [Actinomycetota bacterium]|jgi:glutamate-5-semialdehyde dehydrogenase|nr:glutamate-5-semialdehyde dehydrogenase [Actinomycetota bacterium]
MTTTTDVCKLAAETAPAVAQLSTEIKNQALHAMADALEDNSTKLQAANAQDVERARADGTSNTLIDRLTLTDKRIAGMAEGLRAVAAQPDPIGEVVEGWKRPNGLLIERVRVPLGVVAVIYEARPNVTADVAALCLKSGNACVLRGSSIAMSSNVAVVEVLTEAALKAGVPRGAIQLVGDASRESAQDLMRAKGYVDLLVPRGGKALIQSIEENATVPFIIDGDGNCHVYVDASADPDMATAIVVNAKAQRPSVCNAAETLLVHAELAEKWLPAALDALAEEGVEVRGDERVRQVWPSALEATDEDWATEYLDLKIAVRVVDSLDDAIDHVNKWGTSNAEAIVAQDVTAVRRFAAEVDSGSIFINTSTRFSDGSEFGYGAEIGISTQKLHARGPMGLKELTTTKYVVWGEGQLRS